jgi:hypothetical protein
MLGLRGAVIGSSRRLAVRGFSLSGTGTLCWMQKRPMMESLCSIGLLGCETARENRQHMVSSPVKSSHPPE